MISNYYGFTYYQHPTTIDNFQPYTIPFTSQYEREYGWIPVGLYWDLLDNTPSELIILNNNNNVEVRRGYDNFNGNTNGITINKLYNILIQPDCNKITDYKSNFITLFPTASSSINSLFNVYGY